MADANSSAVVLAGGRGPKDEKARKKKAKVNAQQQPLYPYKLPVHQPGVDGFYCTYGCGSTRADGSVRRSASAGGRSSWSAEGGTGARSRGRIRPVTVMYPEEGFVCCHQGHEPGEEEVDEFEGTEYEDDEDAELVVGGEEEEEYGEEYEDYEEEEGK